MNPVTTAIAFGSAIVATLLQVAVPALTGKAIDVATGAASGSIPTIAWTMVAIALIQYAGQIVRRWSAGNLSIGSQHHLRVEVLDTLNSLDGPSQDDIVTGQIVSRSISDLNQFQSVLAMTPLAVSRSVQLVVTVAVMLTMSPWLTVLSLAFLPVILFIANRSRTTLYAATWANQQATADLAEHVEQTVSGIRVVKAFGKEERAVDTLETLGKQLYAVKMRAAKLTARFRPLLSQLPNVALVITIIVGGILAIRGGITVGEFVAFTAYLTSMTSLMSMLTNTYVGLQMGMSSVDRLDDVLRLRPQRRSPADPLTLGDEPVGIEFRNVGFSSNGHTILNGFDVTVQPGETVAVVGGPGAGKSMAVQLAGAFYEPDFGDIALVGKRDYPYSQLTIESIRQRVTCVFDEAFLFSASVRDNITMGLPASDEDVARVAKLARADEFIEKLSDGYDTVVGERGLTLSGGQRQRIALARALLSAPSVMILDDATSAIDAENEKLILGNLRAELAETTVIAVAHRQSTVDHADRVLVVENGRVVLDGPRDQVTIHPSYQALMAPTLVDEPPRIPTSAELWPDVAAVEDPDFLVTTARPGAGPRGGGGPGMRGGIITATPKLKSKLAHLPEASEQPQLDSELLRRADRPFRIRDLFSAVRWLIAGVVSLLIIGVMADVAFPTLIRAAIDRGIVAQQPDALWAVAGVAVVVVLVALASSVAMTILSSRSGERLLYGLRLRSYAHLQRLGVSYFERNLSGRIMTRMTTDIDTLSNFLQTGLAQAIVSVGTLFGVGVMLVATDGSLTAIALLAVPVIILATVVFRVLSKKYYTEARMQISAVNGQFAELIGGIRTSQMHQMEPRALADFTYESDLYRRLRMRSQLLVALYFPGMQAISQVMTAVVVGVGASRVAQGELSVGVVVAFTMYLGQLYGPIQQLGQIFDSWQQATVSFNRIAELLETQTTVPDTGTNPRAHQAAEGPLEFDYVTFAYQSAEDPSATPVLDQLSVTLRAGETVALVGPTGAGKSTVVKLIARFYDPSSGVVKATGTDISEFPIPQWRRQIAQVPQESYLFPGTVADNIAYGLDQFSKEDVENAVRKIGALHVIAAIPGGFNHHVGERGRGLSAGQRQIIALARAELIDADVMLLDEATATLDPATEKAVLDASSNATRGRTSVIVAHRLATARRADRILVLESGRIIEDGSHDLLLSIQGRYAQMWETNR
ncbi:ABC transporter ATP-binding protein [Corynebacterium breve]|uniref:ABC transporter ATP-binding protein n=1 Tax=Corynebacterium breve TaxID=3049799 RepID=A0ABY8VJP9_9CORY|nr:ABC transporter ATP-binding protein [Corynebacterium breve]WIM69010.1 ABC transporter ATP-binding protein [Corynebacterium breve]